MPELPEVETVKETLKKLILGKTIVDYKIIYPKIVRTKERFDEIIGKKIIDIKRRGKYLIFDLDNLYLISHLRMEGKYFIKNNNEPILKHEHIIFIFDDNLNLRYADTRKFGTMDIVDNLNCSFLNKLGFEPFDINLNEFLKKLKNIRTIKQNLLDQKLIAGIGNIYADEICFKARINPKRIANSLTLKEVENIIIATKDILSEAIKDGGTTIRSYTSSLGVTGRFQQKLMVHTKKECGVCHTEIVKTYVAQRGTYYCPKCQKEEIK